MGRRFIKEKDENGQTIIARTHVFPIEVYGRFDVEFQTGEGMRPLILLNANCVHDFMINIVSEIILHTKNFDFDAQHF